MSIRTPKLIFENYPAGDVVLKACMVILAWWGDDDGRNIFPSVATIAKYLGASKRHTQRILSELVTRGDILVVGNAKGGRPGSTRRYEISPILLAGETGDVSVAPATGDKHVIPQGATGRTGVTNSTATGDKTRWGRVTNHAQTDDTVVARGVDLQGCSTSGVKKEGTGEGLSPPLPAPHPGDMKGNDITRFQERGDKDVAQRALNDLKQRLLMS